MENFKIKTTGRDMVSDIVEAGNALETCPECGRGNLNEEKTICFDCHVIDDAKTYDPYSYQVDEVVCQI